VQRPEQKRIAQLKAAPSRPAAVVQRAPLAQVRVTGNTYLRESDRGTSLARGRNYAPVATGDVVTVDLGDVWGSHQGNGAASENAIHDWYKVVAYDGGNISREDVYIRAATIAIPRREIVNPVSEQELVFEAWLDHVDVGHLLMIDPLTKKSYDFKGAPGGKPLAKEFTRSTRVDPEPADPSHPGPLTPLSQVNVRTAPGPQGVLTGRAQPLTLNITSYPDAVGRQLADPRRDKKGFHAVLRVRIKVTKAEYRQIMLTTLVRKGGGHYNFVREATYYDPLATRCLTPLEDLARMRGIRLMPGSAEWVLRQFVALSSASVVSVDTLQRSDFA
jgi:hypothetical protein